MREEKTRGLKLTVESNISGYLMEDIEKVLSPAEFRNFSDWMRGQTGMTTKEGKMLVYAWDWDRYVRGLPIID